MQDLIISDEEFKSYSEAIGYLTQSMEMHIHLLLIN